LGNCRIDLSDPDSFWTDLSLVKEPGPQIICGCELSWGVGRKMWRYAGAFMTGIVVGFLGGLFGKGDRSGYAEIRCPLHTSRSL